MNSEVEDKEVEIIPAEQKKEFLKMRIVYETSRTISSILTSALERSKKENKETHR